MTEALTAAQMRKLEHAAIETGEVTGLELMERAGRGLVQAVFEEWPDFAAGSHRALVLCGPGNNGGDGFVVARLLAKAGWAVEVFMCGTPENLPPDARRNYERWCFIGDVVALTQAHLMGALERLASDPHALVPVIDALFGIGQRAPLDDVIAPVNAMIDAWSEGQAGASAPLFISVDIPTGYDADTGEALARRPLPSELVVTFHCKKPIHKMPHFLDTRCAVVDIGL
ncbi:NAD(P)H-hydrate epimerase [Tateyamaria sp. Alg231-49]|uniref:NAD(P)H-hydrate epimerase n=1 Tax=Tateyamaria sp. Alg231-49 TaxID=1922219 RepID=UPI0027957C9C|nr:NAD(P)H-hydrate epimerase [Tateyamaria sp. Alg231-49]